MNEDEQIERVLDALDERTEAQELLHKELSNGFMWLARERYRDALATHRLENVVSENREMKSNVRVELQQSQVRDESSSGTIFSFRRWEPAENNDETVDTKEFTTSPGMRRRRSCGTNEQPAASDDASHCETPKDREAKTEQLVTATSSNASPPSVFPSKISPPVMAMPSKEVREGTKCFNNAIKHVLEVAERSQIGTVYALDSI